MVGKLSKRFCRAKYQGTSSGRFFSVLDPDLSLFWIISSTHSLYLARSNVFKLQLPSLAIPTLNYSIKVSILKWLSLFVLQVRLLSWLLKQGHSLCYSNFCRVFSSQQCRGLSFSLVNWAFCSEIRTPGSQTISSWWWRHPWWKIMAFSLNAWKPRANVQIRREKSHPCSSWLMC